VSGTVGPPVSEAASSSETRIRRSSHQLGEAALSDQQRLRAALEQGFRLVWRTLRGLGVQRARVDDAAQSVFLTLAARLRDVAPGRERGFLVQTAVRVAANVRRSQAREHETATERLDDLGTELRDPECLLAAKQRRGLLDRILEALSPELRIVFTLFELEGLTAAEIAVLLEIPPGTVASRLRRARVLFEQEAARFREQYRGEVEP
jgi:RNA polymerase sigma-70 factor, ECF subfamily